MGMRTERTAHNRESLLILTAASLVVFFAALDQTVVVTILPPMMFDIGISVTDLNSASWIITGYLIGYTVAIPITGKLADLYGSTSVLLYALALFLAGSILVAIATSLPAVILGRVIQAIGGGATIPVGITLASRSVKPEHRTIGIGMVGAAAELGLVLGPLYGGFVESWLNWRWAFWLNIPQVAVMAICIRVFPKPTRKRADIDWIGSTLLVGSLIVLLLALSHEDVFQFSSARPYLLGGLSILGCAVLVWYEQKQPDPIVDVQSLRSRPFLGALATKAIVGATLIVPMVTIPLMTSTILDQSIIEGGLRLLRLTAALAAGAVLSGFATTRFGPRKTTISGLLLASLGLFLMSSWGITTPESHLTIYSIITGIGIGLVITPLFLMAIEFSKPGSIVSSVSLVLVARMIGMAIGMAVMASWGAEQFHSLIEQLSVPRTSTEMTQTALSTQLMEYSRSIGEIGVGIFQDFLFGASVLALAAIIPALAIRKDAGKIKDA
jgi:EmrB/QacA subfamily drug resistance transporter